MRYSTIGKIAYGPGIRVVAWVCPDLSKYYLSLIPKSICVRPQAYLSHVTIVRTGLEKLSNFSVWGKYEGEEIDISYDGVVKFDGTYYYLDVLSDRITEIRLELGLPPYRFGNHYHITIGNCKDMIKNQ